MKLRTRTDAIVLHCTATAEFQPWDVEGIDRMHRARHDMDGLGIGYAFLITLDGKVHEGRKPVNAKGCHVRYFNETTIGVSYVGGLRKGDLKPTDTRNPAQVAGMIDICEHLLSMYPNAVILGHRDLSPDKDGDGVIEEFEWMKQCPCFNAGPWAKSVGLPGGKYVKGKFVRL